MGTRYASLGRSVRASDLPERDVIAALISRDECALLLARIAEMPSARSAARSLVALLGRLATPACGWLEGELAVELFEEESVTRIRVMSELGGGLRERVLPAVAVAQPLEDILVAFERHRDRVAVLRLERVSSRCALLLASEEESAPMSIELDISETSLSWSPAGARAAASTTDLDSGWDDAFQTT
jgi:hypothetical protein